MDVLTVIVEWLDTPMARAILTLLGALLFSFLVRFFMKRTLWRLIRHTETDLDDQVLTVLENPIAATVVLIGCGIAINFLQAAPSVEQLSYRILTTAGIVIWSVATIRVASLSVVHLGKKKDPKSFFKPRIQPVLQMLIKIFVLGAATYFVFETWDKNISGWLASAGVVGIAVGFAAKDTLANLFSGVFILADAPYTLGDYIVLDNGERGRVTHIGLRSTRILTRDDVEIIMPNAVMGNSKIINESGGPYEKYRVRLDVGVAYGTDIDLVRSVLMENAFVDPAVVTHPEPRVRFRQFGQSSLDFQLMLWVEKPEYRGRVVDALLTSIYKSFAKHGIEIPYPKRDLYLHQVQSPPSPELPLPESDEA